jgi:hypothetical protein
MTRDPLQAMNNALDQELSEQEWEALQTRLAESAEDSGTWERLQQTDELLRTAPLAAPAPGFASRVMAAIAALPMPGFARQQPGVGIALGLLVAGLITVPIFSVLFFVLLAVITDPGALHSVIQAVLDAVSYLIRLVSDLAGELENMAGNTSVMAALLATMIPIMLLWGWLIWAVLGGRRLLSRRPRP